MDDLIHPQLNMDNSWLICLTPFSQIQINTTKEMALHIYFMSLRCMAMPQIFPPFFQKETNCNFLLACWVRYPCQNRVNSLVVPKLKIFTIHVTSYFATVLRAFSASCRLLHNDSFSVSSWAVCLLSCLTVCSLRRNSNLLSARPWKIWTVFNLEVYE